MWFKLFNAYTHIWPNSVNSYWVLNIHASKPQPGIYSRSVPYLRPNFYFGILQYPSTLDNRQQYTKHTTSFTEVRHTYLEKLKTRKYVNKQPDCCMFDVIYQWCTNTPCHYNIKTLVGSVCICKLHFTKQTHTHTTILRPLEFCLGQPGWAGTKINISSTHTYRVHQSSHICFLHLLQSMASSLFSLRAWLSFSTTSLQVFFGLPLGLTPSTSYSIHFFTQSLPSFCSPCPYYCNLFCCSTEIMSYNPSLSLNPLVGTISCSLTPHIHLTILISAEVSPHFPSLWARSHFHAAY